MKFKVTILLTIISGLLLLTALIGVLFIPQTNAANHVFPFQVSGGTLIESNPENFTGIIWGQSFEIKVNQTYIPAIRYEKFTLKILNFPIMFGLLISGITEEDTFTLQGPSVSILELTGKIQYNRTVTLTASLNDKSQIKFLTMGDTQGFPDLYEEMIASSYTEENAFILHLGDITASGDNESLQKFQNISKTSKIPIFTTPGNHDIKISNSTAFYETYFGEAEYFFEYNGYLFITINSSSGFYSESSFSYLTTLLSKYPSTPKVIFTHIPIFDPRPGKDHDLLNTSQSTRLLSLINNSNVKAVISGHIHYFNHTILNDVHFVTSGGGGAYLYEAPEDGGFHHFTEITIDTNTDEFTINTIPLTKPEQPTDIVISKQEISHLLSLEDLISEFTSTHGNSSFQNQYDNWRANGSYIGIKISTLLEIVGGMASNQWLTVRSWDGLTMNYSHAVVYPNSTWYQIQGDMILAFSFNDSIVPDYADGYRIAFLPPDGSYSNEDCKNTSLFNEGWYVYPSAGYRWVKYVQSLIISGGD